MGKAGRQMPEIGQQQSIAKITEMSHIQHLNIIDDTEDMLYAACFPACLHAR